VHRRPGLQERLCEGVPGVVHPSRCYAGFSRQRLALTVREGRSSHQAASNDRQEKRARRLEQANLHLHPTIPERR